MTIQAEKNESALLVFGCPEVPVQAAIGLYLAGRLGEDGYDVLSAGNPSVLGLLRVSDIKKHYIGKTIDLDRCIGEVAEGKRATSRCVVFAHNDAGISYAASSRYLLPGARLLVIVFGRNAEELAAQVDFPCERVVETAVHNPGKLKKGIDGVFGWRASTS
jgi:threonyl-tRNA synthetase